ncbi:MAG: carboxypeptidase regulatory-like domain-containing protein [Bryobacteraceae bacterium]
MRKLTLIGWGALVLSMAAFWNLPAQEVVAHIRGTVTDPSGAGVPSAEVKATNTQTNVSTTIMSQDDGSYEFLSLPPGTYDVTVTKAGFRTSTSRNITLTLNQIYNLPVSLEVGEVTESVQVEANPTQVETTTTQLGTIIDSKQIVDLPLLGRNWTQLQQLVPGAVSQSDRFNGAYATNGSESQQNSFLINGADTMDIRLNTPLIVPSPDSIGEFNLITSTINPEYGRNSGGVLNAIIKSGTNQFHGDAFEFYRDTFLNSRAFFQPTAPVFHQNQYGGTVGGPIWKDHTFFFLSYQGTRNREPDTYGSGETNVFTQAQRNGYFPDIANSTTASPFAMVGENGATYPARTPYNVLFPSGQIPAADFNPIALNLLKSVPLPNLGGNLYSFNPVETEDVEQGLFRVDHTIGNKDSVWGYMFFQHTPAAHTLSFYGSSLPGYGEDDVSFSTQAVAAWSHTFNPTTLNEFRVAYSRFNYKDVNPTNVVQPSALGFTGITPQFPSVASAPAIDLTGYFNLGFSPYGPQPVIDNTYQLDDNFSKVVGNHTLKFGFDGRRYEVNDSYDAQNNGDFTFGGAGTYTTSDPAADFLLGIPDSYIQSSGNVQNFRAYEYYLYVQDSWKVTNNLVLNYGLGYQIDTPLNNQRYGMEDNNCFFPGQQSTVYPTAPLGLLFPGDTGCSTSGTFQHNDHFAPRFGFAYSPDWGPLSGGKAQKFVIRGGFGVYFNRTEEELSLQQLGDPPFSITSYGASSVGGSPSFANPFADIAGGPGASNPFPFTPAPKGAAVDFSQFLPLDINVTNPNFTDPYAMNFNLNIQRELPGAMVLQVGYVGAQGRHLELTYEGNPISPTGAAECAADPNCVSSRVIQGILYPSHSEYAPGNVFAGVGTQASLGVSSYNSLQVHLQKRLSHGLMFQASYTWGHSIDDTSGYESSYSSGAGRVLNPYNFALNRGDSTFDARNRFVINYDYEVPSLTRYWNNGLVKHVLDGWRVGGITTLQTGFPVIVNESDFRSLECDAYAYYGCWDTPNVVGYPGIYNPRNTTLVNTNYGTTPQSYYYFNPNAFAPEQIGVLGNEGRDNFHGPGLNQTDLVLAKQFRWTESRYVELRLEAFNVFNHTQFAFNGPGIGLNTTTINAVSFAETLTTQPNSLQTVGRVVQLGAKIYF